MTHFKSIVQILQKSANSKEFLSGLMDDGFNLHPDANVHNQPRLQARKVTKDEIIQVFEYYKLDGCVEIAYLQIIGKSPVQINENFWVCK